jgi:hypothetical protein
MQILKIVALFIAVTVVILCIKQAIDLVWDMVRTLATRVHHLTYLLSTKLLINSHKQTLKMFFSHSRAESTPKN